LQEQVLIAFSQFTVHNEIIILNRHFFCPAGPQQNGISSILDHKENGDLSEAAPACHYSDESSLASTEATDASDPAASRKILASLPSASQDHRDSSCAASQESVVPSAVLSEETISAAVPAAIQNQGSTPPSVEQDTVAATSLPSTVASATSEDSVTLALTAGSGSETIRGQIIPTAPANSQEYEPVIQNVVGPSKEPSSSVSMTSPAPVSKKRKPSLPKDPNAPKRPMR
jgi:hypothetical protein